MLYRTALIIASLYTIGMAYQVDKNLFRNSNPPLYGEKAAYSDQINALVKSVSSDSIQQTLQYLDQKGIRSGVTVLNEVRTWISARLTSYGYMVGTQDVTGSGSNFFVEKKGSTYPEIRVIVGGHYDSVTNGPGINDNGTGTAVLLEIARVFQKTDLEYSILLVWFVGEEKGFVGSTAYVNKISAEGMKIKVMFNLDEVGGVSNSAMTTITCERDVQNSVAANDAASKMYTDTLAMVTNTYTSLQTAIENAYGSDYMTFEAKGYVITGYYEKVSGGNPYYHTANDVFANLNMPYVFETAKGAVAYTAQMARCRTSVPLVSAQKDQSERGFSLLSSTVNVKTGRASFSFDQKESGAIRFDLFDLSGKRIYTIDLGQCGKGRHVVQTSIKKLPATVLLVRPVVNSFPRETHLLNSVNW